GFNGFRFTLNNVTKNGMNRHGEMGVGMLITAEYVSGADLQPKLFADLSDNRLFQSLPLLYLAAREFPHPPKQRVGTAFVNQHTVPIMDQRGNHLVMRQRSFA